MTNGMLETFTQLGIAIAIGLTIGLERGWKDRESDEGLRVAGLRTFGLIGLLGGLWGLLAHQLDTWLLGFAFLALASLLIVAHVVAVSHTKDFGITTIVAGLITFALGALAVSGSIHVATAGAIITALILSLKPLLHGWLKLLDFDELSAILKLALIWIVILPLMPDQGFGPWQAINPYQIWWMVVLIAGISFAGYAAIKIVGSRKGLLITGFLGGLVSSTAATLNLSKLAQKKARIAVICAAILLAETIMFPRILLEIAVVNRDLLVPTLLPILLMTAVMLVGVIVIWHRKEAPGEAELPVTNPFQIKMALQFGLLLALVMFLAQAFMAWLGDAGIYLVALISGIADVDAITLSLASMARSDLAPETAVRGIVIAAIANTLFKTALALMIAGRQMLWRLLPVALIACVAGGVSLFWL
ncbi:MgtC/SapB family protein [Thiohalophilus sp.]|uniref:MgtC/SapB family protein n=1 Tax=Thiohalophilus sp. TaxID=3028392 RepID=UPI002ACE95F5|nr:MgtC/SapB family protein [Thiohalophilus sp.]MDZ7663070.1 MgtC/SapB family protein [Thiohalophilus sp.]